MKVTMAMVMSLDGRITDGDKPGASEWASPEDQANFARLKQAHDAIIMGRATYDTIKTHLVPDADKPRVVLTRWPEEYDAAVQPGLEFSDAEPRDVLSRLAIAGYGNALLLGGEETNTRFLSEGLVDELAITVEPVMFGHGKQLYGDLPDPVDLRLISSEQLNEAGTMYNRYEVIKANT